jgi:hypothetical protein
LAVLAAIFKIWSHLSVVHNSFMPHGNVVIEACSKGRNGAIICGCSLLMGHRAAEQAQALQAGVQPTHAIPDVLGAPIDSDFSRDMVTYTLAKTYFDLKEFHRAAMVLRDCRSRKAVFLRAYASYLVGPALASLTKQDGERRKEDEVAEVFGPEKTKATNKSLPELMATLTAHRGSDLLDGFGLYLFGVILKVRAFPLQIYRCALWNADYAGAGPAGSCDRGVRGRRPRIPATLGGVGRAGDRVR